jgi:hypothetical protein
MLLSCRHYLRRSPARFLSLQISTCQGCPKMNLCRQNIPSLAIREYVELVEAISLQWLMPSSRRLFLRRSLARFPSLQISTCQGCPKMNLRCQKIPSLTIREYVELVEVISPQWLMSSSRRHFLRRRNPVRFLCTQI